MKTLNTVPAIMFGIVRQELERQQELLEAGRIPFVCSDPDVSSGAKLAVLVEEVGEVAAAMQDAGIEEMEEELYQVAAVALAWIASLDR